MDIALKVIGTMILVIALRETWVAIYSSRSALAESTGVSLQSMATYTIISVLLQLVLTSSVSNEISSRVGSGDIASDFQKPWNFLLYHLVKSMGESISGVVYVVLPLLIFAAIMFQMSFPSGWQALLFMLSCLFAYLISYAISFMLGLLAFLFTQIWGFQFVLQTVVQFCSGSFIPLWLFPEGMLRVIQWLPFRGMFHIPLSIFIGKLTGTELLNGLLFQLVWAALLLTLAHFSLKNMERLLITTGG
jgi:ABC-2 type transport system permease protein